MVDKWTFDILRANWQVDLLSFPQIKSVAFWIPSEVVMVFLGWFPESDNMCEGQAEVPGAALYSYNHEKGSYWWVVYPRVEVASIFRCQTQASWIQAVFLPEGIVLFPVYLAIELRLQVPCLCKKCGCKWEHNPIYKNKEPLLISWQGSFATEIQITLLSSWFCAEKRLKHSNRARMGKGQRGGENGSSWCLCCVW